MGIADKLLDRPVAIGVVSAAVLAIGLLCFPLIPIDTTEEADTPRLTVNLSWPGASAVVIESRLTAPLESLVRGVSDVVELRSVTSAGRAYITAEFARTADLQLAELELNEKIHSFFRQRPPGVSYPVVRRFEPDLLRDLRGFILFQVLGRENPAALRTLVEDKVRLPLLSVPGVREVSVQGGREQGVLIELDHALAQRWGIDLRALRAALAAQDMQTRSLGTTKAHGTLSRIQLQGGVEHLDALRRIPLKRMAGSRVLYLGDVATVRYQSSDPQVLYRINGRNGIAVQVEKMAGSDMISTSRRVRTKLAALATQLPEEVEIVVLNDEGAHIEDDLRFLLRRSAFSVLCIALVLIGVFKRLQTPALILCSVALSVLGAFSLFFLFGLPLNLITLAGFTIGFGIIIDNAIVVYDYIHRRAEDCGSEGDLKEAVAEGLREVMYPLVISNLTTLGAFLPVFFLSAQLQRHFTPFVVSLGLTLILALVFALTLIPTFYYQSVRRVAPSPAADRRLYGAYRSVLTVCVRRKGWVLGLVAWMVGVPLWLLPDEVGTRRGLVEKGRLIGAIETRQEYQQWLADRDSIAAQGTFGSIMLMSEREKGSGSAWTRLYDGGTQLYNTVWGNPLLGVVKPALFSVLGGATYFLFRDVGHRIEEAPYRHLLREITEGFSLIVFLEMPHNAHISRLDGLLQGIEKQLLLFSPYIRGIITQTYGRYGLVQVLLEEEYKKSNVPYVLYDNLAAYGHNIGGVGFRIWGQDLEPEGRGLGGGLSASRRLEVKGYNFRQVGQIAAGIAERLQERRSRRIKDIHIDRAHGPPRYEVLVQIDHAKTAPLGLDHAAVADQIQTRLDGGAPVAKLYVDRREYMAAVADTAARRTDLRRLKQALLAEGGARIGDVSHLQKHYVRPEIKRENQRYIKEVGFTILGDFSYAEMVVQDIMDHTPIPYGYSLSRGYMMSVFSEEEERELALIVLLSVVLVWMIAAALFESWTWPLLVLLALPLALIGVGAGFYLSGASFDQGGYASLLLLMGISVNNSILLVHHISRALRTQPASPQDAVTRAAFQRLRPIFITTLTTIAGFLPLLLQGDRGDIWYTLALGTSGGLISSSVLVVLVVPLCLIWRGSARLRASYEARFNQGR